MMNSLDRALRRIGADLFLLGSRIAKPAPYTINLTDEEWDEFKTATGRPRRGIPAADRGDALDFDWETPHGDSPQ
jgi:hypothetical protein